MAEVIDVEVAFAQPEKQQLIPIKLLAGSSVHQAIKESRILEQFPEIDLEKMSVGVFSKACKLEKTVEQGDRVEIYRSLQQTPMDARRHRAVKS